MYLHRIELSPIMKQGAMISLGSHIIGSVQYLDLSTVIVGWCGFIFE